MNLIVQILLLLTCLLQASPLDASSNPVIPNHTPSFSNQAIQKVESEEKAAVFHFVRSGIEENILQPKPTHFSSSKQSPTFLKDAFQNFGVLHLEKSLAKSWVGSQDFSKIVKLSLV